MDLEGPPDSMAPRFAPIMRASFISVAALLFAFIGYIAFDFLSGGVRGPAIGGALVGAVIILIAGALTLRWALRFRIARDASLQDRVLRLESARWRVDLSPMDTRRVLQLKGDPYRVDVVNLPGWRQWVRIDGPSGVYLVVRQDPVGFLSALADAGFPVVDDERGDAREDLRNLL